ncbi:MAG: cupredoxin domain-containing protein [Armatimonadetes bacterium]|nr:cupredoxin domain-containing protein [Armatimonadota bacterium]
MIRWFLLMVFAVTLAVAVVPAFDAAAAPRTQKVTITMTDFRFTPDKITLTAGTRAEITLMNTGKVEHEFMMHDFLSGAAAGQMGQMAGQGGQMSGKMGQMSGSDMHETWERTSYFKGLPLKVVVGGVETSGRDINELLVAPGARAVVKFTPTRKGSFEIACHLPKHYEQGQKGTITVQ